MCRILFPNELVIQACLSVLAVIAYRESGQSWFVVSLRDNEPNMRLPIGTMVALGLAQLAGPQLELLLTKSVFDKSWDSPLQKLIPLSVSPLLLCRLKLSPHSQSRILEISLGDWISNSAASKTIKIEKCSFSLVNIPAACLWWNIVMPRLIN